MPTIDRTIMALVALRRLLESVDVLGRDDRGWTVISIAVEDWMFGWFMTFGTDAGDLEPEPIEDDDGC
jgi:hypothetical protein